MESDGNTAISNATLTRWIVDPTLGLDQAEADEKALKAELTGGAEA